MLTITGIEIPQMKKTTEIVSELWMSAWGSQRSIAAIRRKTPLKQAGNTRQGALQEHDTAVNMFSKALT